MAAILKTVKSLHVNNSSTYRWKKLVVIHTNPTNPIGH